MQAVVAVMRIRIVDAEFVHAGVAIVVATVAAALSTQLPEATADRLVRFATDVDPLPPGQTGTGASLLQPGIGFDRQQQPQAAVIVQPRRSGQ